MPTAKATETSEHRPGTATVLAAQKFHLSHLISSQSIPDSVLTGDKDEVNVEANVTVEDEDDYSKKTATQIEGDVKELFKGATVNHEIEREEDDDIVPKFIEGFTLLPHQIQARKWMMERESGRSHGGILADDMGSVLLSILLVR